MSSLKSASGVLSLLQEPERELKQYALRVLLDLADEFWAEIADSLGDIEELYEDRSFPEEDRQLAALVASKVFFHLGSLNDALQYALGAGPLFDVSSKTEYVETLIAKCIEEYFRLSVLRDRQSSQHADPASPSLRRTISGFSGWNQPAPSRPPTVPESARPILHSPVIQGPDGSTTTTTTLGGMQLPSVLSSPDLNAIPTTDIIIDSRLEDVVERMFARCFADGEYEQAIGIALESLRLDKIREAFLGDDLERKDRLLKYVFTLCMREGVSTRGFRIQVLRLLVELYEDLPTPDWGNVLQCLIFLGEPFRVADILRHMLEEDAENDMEGPALVAYQLAFDLFDNASQRFLVDVRDCLPDPPAPRKPKPKAVAAPPVASTPAPTGAPSTTVPPPAPSKTAKPDAGEEPDTMEVEGQADAASDEPKSEEAATVEEEPEEPEEPIDPVVERRNERMRRCRSILEGDIGISLRLSLLCRACNSDLVHLHSMKQSVDPHTSLLNLGVCFANSLMHAGTTQDVFLRDNLEWLARFTNWAKFSATASLGVIHKGHLNEGLNVLAPYLPPAADSGRPSGSPYSEGGSLYALGLVHANHGQGVVKQFLDTLRQAESNEVLQHGVCLGLGVATMAAGLKGTEVDQTLYEPLKNVLFTDSAVAGEAAAIGIGLMLAGSGTAAGNALDEMIAYAHDTNHEKIVRGVALAAAMMSCLKEEEADIVIDQLCMEKDPILRYGGMMAIGMAYAGTVNDTALRRLLYYVVSDTSDDVKRAGVTAVGFLLCRAPQECPRIVGMLSDSYNPYVRHGAALALGIACAATGLPAAVDILNRLATDPVDYVRQAALIGLAMVYQCRSQAQDKKVVQVREMYSDILKNKHESVMARFGASIGMGIIDAGGRNATISLASRRGHNDMTAIIGTMLFSQYWHWYPFIHMISLSFRPCALIGVNAELKMPKFQFTSNASPSMFAYPPPMKVAAKAEVKKATKAVLSVTRKAEARAKAKAREAQKTEDGDAPVADAKPEVPAAATDVEEEKDGKKEEEAPVKEKEPSFEILSNPHRVTPAQVKLVTFSVDRAAAALAADAKAKKDAKESSAEKEAMDEDAKEEVAPDVDQTQRYRPALTQVEPVGIIVMKDTMSELPVEYVLASDEEKPEPEAEPEAEAEAEVKTPAEGEGGGSEKPEDSEKEAEEEEPAPPEGFVLEDDDDDEE